MQFKGMISSFFFLSLVSTSAFSMSLPENKLHKAKSKKSSTVTEEQFNLAIDTIANLYRPSIEAHGATLTVVKEWASDTVNAFANQEENVWMVTVHGGIARDEAMTLDGLSFIVCHEFGHHLGGYTFYEYFDWAANEGQSDYFAAHVCARALWEKETEVNAQFRELVTGYSKAQCDIAWRTEAEQNLCYRTVMAGLPLAAITSRIYGTTAPTPENHDESVVATTNQYHPDGQCRLDTAAHGASCSAPFDINVIPGRNHAAGQHSADAELVAAASSCIKPDVYKAGFRPRCWFKSLTVAE